MLAAVAILVRVSGVPLHLPLNNLKAFRLILIITFRRPRLLHAGRSRDHRGIHRAGAHLGRDVPGGVFSMRLMVIMLIAALLMLTTAPLDVSDGIERVLKPLERSGCPPMSWP